MKKQRDKNKAAIQQATEATFIARVSAGMTPMDAAKWLAKDWKVSLFIKAMKPVMEAAFLEVTPMAMNRVQELLYAKKKIVWKAWVFEIDDNDIALKAAEVIFKNAWLWQKEVPVSHVEQKKDSLMDAIVIDENDSK